MKKKILLIVSFVTVFILSFRFFFQTQGVVGHNWDWTLPSLNIFSEKLNIFSVFTWNCSQLGRVVKLTIVHLFPTSLFVLIGKLLGVRTLQFLLFFLVELISFISFKKLLDFLLEKSLLNYVPSFLYAFSPFLFNDIIGGSWPMWISYSLCPLYFVFLINFFKKGNVKKLFILLFLSIWIVISIQNFVLINLLALFYILGNVVIGNFTLKSVFQKSILFLFLIILINLYWIIPLSYTFTDFVHDNILVSRSVYALPWIENSRQSIWNIFNLSGYFDRNMYLFSTPLIFKNFFHLIIAFVFVGILISFIFEKNKINLTKGAFWLSLLLVLILVVKGGNNPFSAFTLWLYRNFVLMRIYRSPQHLMFIPAFIIPILIAFSLSYFYKKLKHKRIVLIIFGILITVWISGWWYNGDLGHKTLLKQGKDHVDFYQLPPELIKYYEESQKDKINYRSFFLPSVYSPKYLKTEYQNEGQGLQPEYLYLDKPTFTSENNIFANNVELSFCKNTNFDYIKYLSLFSVKNIILRSDIRPHFTKSSNCWDNNFVKARLDSSIRLKKFLEGEYTVAYKINDEYFLPHFYLPRESIYWKGKLEDLVDILGMDDYSLRSEILLDTGEEKDNLLVQLKNDENKKIFVKTFPDDLIQEEELETYKSSKKLKTLEVKYSPASPLYSLALKKEEFDLKNKKNSLDIFDYNLQLADKRISEFLVFKKDNFDFYSVFFSGYKKAINDALNSLLNLKNEKNENYLDSLVRFNEILESQKNRLQKFSSGGELTDSLENIFEDYQKKSDALKPSHDFNQSKYQFNLPKEGNYEIYVRETDIGGTKPDIGDQILDTAGNWKLFDTKYFSQNENKYFIKNEKQGENIVDENFKIIDFSGDSVYRLSLSYQSEKDRGYFSINDPREGKLFEYNLPKTNQGNVNFEMFFKPTGSAEQAFVILSVEEYENLKIEKIVQPELLLKLKDIGNQKLDIGPKITFSKVNPTKYRILVEDAKEPYSIVFSESFHKGWKVYWKDTGNQKLDIRKYGETVASYFEGDIKEGTHRMNFLEKDTFETWKLKPISEERHYLVNGYANAWRILPQDTKDLNDYELIVEFEPQRLYYIGLFVSLTTLGICFIFMAFSFLTQKRLKRLN